MTRSPAPASPSKSCSNRRGYDSCLTKGCDGEQGRRTGSWWRQAWRGALKQTPTKRAQVVLARTLPPSKEEDTMHQSQEMLSRHPRPATSSQALRDCLEACFDCAFTCTACADACIAEAHVDMLRRCIRLNLDCADLCQATGRALARQTDPDWAVLRIELEACAAICDACARECERHAQMHEHCRICAEACRRCLEHCRRAAQGGAS